MNVRVLLFAGAREAARADHVSVRLPAGATYADLAKELQRVYPNLQRLAAVARFAADAGYVDPSEAIAAGAEIALIPPVSGG